MTKRETYLKTMKELANLNENLCAVKEISKSLDYHELFDLLERLGFKFILDTEHTSFVCETKTKHFEFNTVKELFKEINLNDFKNLNSSEHAFLADYKTAIGEFDEPKNDDYYLKLDVWVSNRSSSSSYTISIEEDFVHIEYKHKACD